jgi:UDP-2-acetamido-3-amino-2,3-dideoxy-glucuronate N-acetyltransferase
LGEGLEYMPVHDAELGPGVLIPHPDLVNVYGCVIGAGTSVGPFVEIQRDARIGARCKISSHSFICAGVVIEDEVFIGHGVVFTNDLYPRATSAAGELQNSGDWTLVQTLVRSRAAIGSNATILAGVVIGYGAMVGGGAVVTRDVPDHALVTGVPAKYVGDCRLREASAQAPGHLRQTLGNRSFS